MDKKIILLSILLLLTLIGSVNAHGTHISSENDTMIVIADNNTGLLAKQIVDSLNLNIKVYNFHTEESVLHELGHLKNSTNKVLAVAYHDTINKYLAENPDMINQIFLCDPTPDGIKNGLLLMKSSINSSGFITPLATGLIIGIIIGLSVGVFIIKRKGT